ncbi:MAG: phosphotransferase, partial [bacterium]
MTHSDPTLFHVERTIDECLRARAERRERPYQVATVEDVRAPLAAWLQEELDRAITVENLVRAPGGASKENFFFDLVDQHTRRALLLRLDPGASIVETHRLREFQILHAVHGVIPVPQVIAVDAEGTRMGRPALIMEKVSGRPQPEVGGRPSGVGMAFEPALRESLAGDFVNALVQLHALNWRDHTLSAFEVPRA